MKASSCGALSVRCCPVFTLLYSTAPVSARTTCEIRISACRARATPQCRASKEPRRQVPVGDSLASCAASFMVTVNAPGCAAATSSASCGMAAHASQMR